MRKLCIGIIDLTTNGPSRTLYSRIINANFSSIMPQVIACWCEEEGHDVTFVCYTGLENLVGELPNNVDLVFIAAFTQAAQIAYALSNLFRSRGAITAIGGPHARCYPQDARQYFDYVLGFTDRDIIRDVLYDSSHHRPTGLHISAKKHPATLPGVQERWKFIDQTLRKAYFLKVVPMIGSLGCPYSCSFCIDSAVPYQPLNLDVIKDDLQFLLQKFRKPCVSWHDPNFGFQFNNFMDAIEEAIPPDRINFIAESSLSLLSEPRLERLQKNGFKAILPGIESWYSLGNKSNTGKVTGLEKVQRVSEQVNMISNYIPYTSANIMIGFDRDEGRETFELTKRFVDLTPGVFHNYLLFIAFGQASRLNLQYQTNNRVLPFPFHLLGNQLAMNVKPNNISWIDFYKHLIILTKYTFSRHKIINRFRANKTGISSLMCLLRSATSEQRKIKYFSEVHRLLQTDIQFRRYYEQETIDLPQFYKYRILNDLGSLSNWLPKGALYHDPNDYLKSKRGEA
jgi:hypothetical protein